MVFIARLVGAAALLSGFATALPRPDSALGDEVAVSAPNGIPLTDSVELASQTAAEAQTTSSAMSSSSYGSGSGSSSGYGSSGSSGSYGNGDSGSDNQWSSSAQAATTTSSAWNSYSTPMYGSGQSNWGGSGYDDCVSQCVAKFGAPAAAYVPPTATSNSDSGSSGSGATHTVIVAPTQGVLRYIPFALNASVGDTIKFMWGANNHTVTKSSELLPCNKSTDALFTSGSQNKDFVFTQVVNDTNPTFFHCGTPGHCQQGMFGIINPPNAIGAPTSVSGMMQSIASTNPDVSAYAAYTTSQTSSNNQAAKWGGSINLASLPAWSHPLVAENVLFTRNFLASNSEVLKDDGSIDLSNSGSTPLMIPQDIGAALNNAGASPSGTPATPSAPATSGTSTSTPSPTGAAENSSNGAKALASPQMLVGLFVIASTFFAL